MNKSCETCLYRATHEKCDGCLHPAGWPDSQGFAYDHWVAGNLGEAFERQHAMEVAGERNIVIGGEGEAEVNAKWTVKQAHKHLYEVSCACGYMTSSPVFHGDEARIKIRGSWNGPRILIWKSGVLERIERENGQCTWDRHPGHMRAMLGKAYDCPGTPRAMMAC